MTLRNAFENLSTEAKQDTIITALASLLTELNQKYEGGAIALDAATLAALEAITVSGTVAVSNHPTPQTDGLTNAELRATAPAVKDDYQSGECLAEQTGAGAVLTFTFSAPVQLVHVEGDGADTDVARVDPFGGTPSATVGFRASDGVGVYLPVTTSSVKVFAPTGMVITVNGFRRT